MRDINFAIVGFGGIAKTHALGAYNAGLNFNLSYNLKLNTIITRKPLGKEVIGAKNYTSFEEAVASESIDFVDICTPNDSHMEIVNKAVKFNKPIYCEKPLASSYKSALEMSRLVKENGIPNAVALIYRFMPSIRLIKREIEQGTIGDIIDFKIKLYHKSYLEKNKKETWRTKDFSGGGALLDLGIHLVDVIYFTLGEIERVQASTKIFFKDRTSVDEIANCALTLKGGALGSLEVSRIFADMQEPTTFTIYGSKGSIKMNSDGPFTVEIYNYEDNCLITKSAKAYPEILKFYPSERNSLGFIQDCHTASLINFSNMLTSNVEEGEVTPTFEDALRAQRVIEACYLSGSTGKAVNVFDI